MSHPRSQFILGCHVTSHHPVHSECPYHVGTHSSFGRLMSCQAKQFTQGLHITSGSSVHSLVSDQIMIFSSFRVLTSHLRTQFIRLGHITSSTTVHSPATHHIYRHSSFHNLTSHLAVQFIPSLHITSGCSVSSVPALPVRPGLLLDLGPGRGHDLAQFLLLVLVLDVPDQGVPPQGHPQLRGGDLAVLLGPVLPVH